MLGMQLPPLSVAVQAGMQLVWAGPVFTPVFSADCVRRTVSLSVEGTEVFLFFVCMFVSLMRGTLATTERIGH